MARTPPHKEYPVWTEARFRQFIRSALRKAWSRWPPKFEVLDQGRRSVTGKRHKFEYQCADCEEWFQKKYIQVDHITPAGGDTDWNEFIRKLFVGVEKLQRLCIPCHARKTKEERK